MTTQIALADVFLDSEPLGLSDSMEELGQTFTAFIGSEDQPEPGSTVYFGVDLEIGDVAEVKAKVLSVEPAESGFCVEVEVSALDSRYVGPLTKALKGGQAQTAGEGGPTWALGLKQTNGAFATLVNSPAGLLNAEQLAKIAEITGKGAGLAKLTHAQRVILLLKPEQLDTVSDELASVGLRVGVLHHGIRNIRGCCGALCRWAQDIDGLGLALEIDKALYGRPVKFDVKIAVSDCARNCMESYCVDIGLIGERGSYSVYVGGAASMQQIRGIRVATGLTAAQTIPAIERILEWYEGNALPNERLHKTLERLGMPEAQARGEELFASAAKAFEGVTMGEDISHMLDRKLARAFGAKKLQGDLSL